MLFFWSGIFSAQAQDQARWVAPTLPSPPAATSEEALKAVRMQEYMQELYNQNQFNGVVLVAQKGRILYQGAWGWSNIAQKDTLNLDTPFRLASVSKQFTAMAIMILKEAGKLHYDEPITKYLPELPYSQVSIRHLLHHNSGLPDYFGIGWSIQQFFPAGKLIDNADMLRYFSVRQPKLVFKPGQKASYSNTGYVFLAAIVERVSGIPFAEFLDKNIFQPLGMKNTFVYNTKNYQTYTKCDTLLVRQDTVLRRENEMKIETILKVETHLQKNRTPPGLWL
ncbi:MAG: beta-lactamase family protein [Microscillaceae bacterium]|nr:beta-lactamase family protein [Microscillaceae bacterium]